MKVYIQTTQSIHRRYFVTPLVQHINIIGNTLEMIFDNERVSLSVFNHIKSLGLLCSHAGKNAPDGPMVMIHDVAKNNYNLKIV